MGRIRIGRHTVETTDADILLFPDDGITKGDLIDYYRRIAPVMLPHIRGHPVEIERFPDGIGEPQLVETELPAPVPEWIRRTNGGAASGRVVCDRAATLVYLAEQAVITPHVWLSQADNLNSPDRMVFDLASADGDVAAVREAALTLREVLEELRLPPFVMVTGTGGLQIVVPLTGREDFDDVHAFAREVTGFAVQRHPGRFTSERDGEGGRLYLDVRRNAWEQTMPAPYSVRSLPGAPIAAPITWREASSGGPVEVNMRTVFERLTRSGDPWAGMQMRARSLRRARRAL